MTKITCRKQLMRMIPWFTANRYKSIEATNLTGVHEELFLRYAVKLYLDRGEPDAELQSELFKERYPDSLNDDTHFYDENVHPLHSYDIVNMASQLPKGSLDSGEHDYLHRFGNVESHSFDGKGICVGISLSHATDKEILKELARLLPKVRKELNAPNPKRSNTKKGQAHRKLFYYGVFEYLDLTLWAEVHGYELELSFIADLISHRELITYDYLRKNTVSYAKKAMTFEYLERLKADIKNFK